MKQDLRIEKTDIVVIFNELDHRFVDSTLFKNIADLEKDPFGSSLISDKNPASPFFQLTLPQSRIIIHLQGNKLVISDEKGIEPIKSDLITTYFKNVYYPLIDGVISEAMAFGFNYVISVKDPEGKLDKSLGIETLQSRVERPLDSYNISASFIDNAIKYTIFIYKVGDYKKIQINSHFDVIDKLQNIKELNDEFIAQWEFVKKIEKKLYATK